LLGHEFLRNIEKINRLDGNFLIEHSGSIE